MTKAELAAFEAQECVACHSVGWYAVEGPNEYSGEAEQQQIQCQICTSKHTLIEEVKCLMKENISLQRHIASLTGFRRTLQEDQKA